MSYAMRTLYFLKKGEVSAGTFRPQRKLNQLTTYCLTLLYERWSEGDVLCYERNRYRPQLAVRFRTLLVRIPCPPPPQ